MARQGWVGSMARYRTQPCGGLGGAAPAGARGGQLPGVGRGKDPECHGTVRGPRVGEMRWEGGRGLGGRAGGTEDGFHGRSLRRVHPAL